MFGVPTTDLGEEAKAVVESCPAWNPGRSWSRS